jgi:hypothetical protein
MNKEDFVSQMRNLDVMHKMTVSVCVLVTEQLRMLQS